MPLTKLSPWHARIKIYANIFLKECDEIETNFSEYRRDSGRIENGGPSA